MLAQAQYHDPFEELRPRIEAMTRQGHSRWAIADALNEDGTPSKSGKAWNETMVSQACAKLGIQPRRADSYVTHDNLMIERLAKVMYELKRDPQVVDGGWDKDFVRTAIRMDIVLAGPDSYSRRFHKIRDALDLANAHIGYAPYSREGVSVPLNAYVKAYGVRPSMLAKEGVWEAESVRRAHAIGVSLPRPVLFEKYFGNRKGESS